MGITLLQDDRQVYPTDGALRLGGKPTHWLDARFSQGRKLERNVARGVKSKVREVRGWRWRVRDRVQTKYRQDGGSHRE